MIGIAVNCRGACFAVRESCIEQNGFYPEPTF